MTIRKSSVGTAILNILLLLSSAFFLFSCNSNDSEKVTGQFVDDLIQGIDYSCHSSGSDVTNSSGQFSCYQYDNVTFSLGDVTLGTVSATTRLVTPFTLFPDDFDAAINLARLLQSLDSDSDPDNGIIVIDQNLVNLLPADTDFSSPDFVSEIESALGITLVSTQQAIQTLSDGIVQFSSAGTLPDGTNLPVADAGQDQSVTVGSTVILDGSGSLDADGDTLVYSWGLDAPAGSSAQLTSPYNVHTTFVADVAGTYDVLLIVFDGMYTNYEWVTITANDAAELPPAPTGVQATPSDGQVTLTWNPVTGATSYTVYMDTVAGIDKSDTQIGAGSNTQFNFYGDNGTTYYFAVTATNANGESELSSEVSATPQATPPATPSVPQGVQATAGDGEVTLSWTAVSGAAGYTVYWNTTGGVSASDTSINAGSATQINHTGLINGTTYYYRVSANNISGESDLSSEVSATPEGVVPTAPEGVQATAGDAEVTLSWNAVSGATSYTIYWNTSGGVTTSDTSIDAGSATQISHTGLTNGTTYYYRVSASNATGESVLSSQVSATPQAVVPATPLGVQATADDSLVALTWNAVSGATGYAVYWNTTSGVSTSDASIDAGSATQISHTGLTNGTTYYYRVAASNTAGESNLSSEVSATPSAIPMPPDEPQNLTAITGDGTVTLAWDAIDDAVSYTIYWSTADYVSSSDTSESVLTNQYVHTGLEKGTTYRYKVSATNDIGEGSLSSEVASTQKTDWLWMHPQPSGLDFKGLAGCNNNFVGVTAAGGIFTSSDNGLNWTEGNSGTLDDFTTVACDDNRFVAAGNGFLHTSQDGGDTWLKLAYGNSSLYKVIWAGGQFIGVGGGNIMTSPNGLSWTTTSVGTSDTIAWNGSQYVATWFYGGGAVYTSEDGINWTEYSTPLVNIEEIIWNGTEFIAIPSSSYLGNVFTSPDGVTWTDAGSGPNVNLLYGDIIWDGSQIIGTGQNGLIATSDDGITWSQQSTGTSKHLNAIGTNGVTYLAGGYGGTVLSSTTLSSWNLQLPTAPLTQDFLYDILWDGSQFIAVGGSLNQPDIILTSSNGTAWTASDNGAGSGGLQSVAYNGSDTYVVVGAGKNILSSPDGVSWTSQNSGLTSYGALLKVIWAGTQFVAVGGYNDIITSPDGITWTVRSTGGASPDPSMRSITWNGTRLVAIRSNYSTINTIITSDDGGVTWTERLSPTSRLDDVIWANGMFLVTGSTNNTYTSTNGIDWTTNTPTGLVTGYQMFVEWDGSQFVTNITNTIYTSTNGVAWDAAQITGLSENKVGFEAMDWGGSDQAVGVGIEGMILINSSW